MKLPPNFGIQVKFSGAYLARHASFIVSAWRKTDLLSVWSFSPPWE
jgi:hypothetical protein